MPQQKTFPCASCTRSSDFSERVTRRVEQAVPRGASKADALRSEARTYRCQHCDTDNVVTKPAGFWVLIDG